MTKLYVKTQLFFADKEAASAIEYALVAAMVAVVIGVFITPISTQIKTMFQSIVTAMGGS